MTQANDSFRAAPDGTGDLWAMHAVNGKKHQVVMLAGPGGHVEGSLDTYLLAVPPQAVGANKLHFDLWNGSGSAVLKVRGVWVTAAQDVANTAAVSVRLDWFRTSTAGTGGTAAAYNGATVGANITPKDTTNAALPSGVTARAAPTGGATVAAWLFPTYHGTEELQVHAALGQWNNVLPNPDRGEQEITLRPSQGLLGRQGTVASAGNLGFLVSFTVE